MARGSLYADWHIAQIFRPEMANTPRDNAGVPGRKISQGAIGELSNTNGRDLP